MTDFIVIGAGAIGSAAAYYLCKRGYSVTVLEKSQYVGDGGSSRNGGGVRQSGRHPAELPLALYAVKNIWPNLSLELGTDIEYYQEGNLRLGKTEAHLNILKGLVKSGSDGGLDLRMIDGKEAQKICSYLSDEVIGASWCPTDGHANPMLVTLAFYRAARKLGVKYITGVNVLSLEKSHGKVSKVVTSEGVFEAGHIVLVGGYGSRAVLNSISLDVPMSPVLLECLVTEESPPMFYQMLGTAMSDFYGHQSKHGSFVFGGTHGLEQFALYDEKKDDLRASSIANSSTCRGIISYFPSLQDLKIVRSWAGWIDDCADHIPVIDNPPETEGLTVGCGFSGHGFGISPVAGLLLAQLAAGEKTVLDISAFRYDRFKART